MWLRTRFFSRVRGGGGAKGTNGDSNRVCRAGQDAIHTTSGKTFAEVEDERAT